MRNLPSGRRSRLDGAEVDRTTSALTVPEGVSSPCPPPVNFHHGPAGWALTATVTCAACRHAPAMRACELARKPPTRTCASTPNCPVCPAVSRGSSRAQTEGPGSDPRSWRHLRATARHHCLRHGGLVDEGLADQSIPGRRSTLYGPSPRQRASWYCSRSRIGRTSSIRDVTGRCPGQHHWPMPWSASSSPHARPSAGNRAH
jgi:hypothetical protein